MKNSTLKNLVIFSSALFVGASALYIYSPTFGSHAAESKEAEVNLTVASTLGIRTSADNLNLEANVGDFVHGAIDVDVTTNSQYGYTLTLEDSDNESSLVHTNTSISDKVTSEFEGAKTSAQMEDNTWGFSLNTTDYYYVPTLGNPARLKSTTGSTAGNYDTTAVDFGAKVGMSLTAGTYTDTVKFTAYVNGADGNPAEDVTASEPGVVPPNYCKNVPYVTGNTLTDPRDGETYTVRSYDDGRCWMTENLRIVGTITKENSDITADSYTIPDDNWGNYWESSDTEEDYYNYPYTRYNHDAKSYGALYNYVAATAGTITGMDNQDEATESVCPKGWKMPSKDEYSALMRAYGADPDGYGGRDASQIMRTEPLTFSFSGDVDYGGRYINYRNDSGAGYWWTTTSESETKRYRAFVDPYSTSVSRDTRKFGFSIRCVARN